MPADTEQSPRPAAGATGKRLWRGLEEWAASDECAALLAREFPEQAGEWSDPVTRRQFLTLMGASLALAGVSGCSPRPKSPEKIMPYVRQPERLTPGVPLYFATAMPLCGVATGLLVKSVEGRPVKAEGNPSHPASLGATDSFAQASLLGLYDPDRSQAVTFRGSPRPWDEALSALRVAMGKLRARRGAGLRLLTDTVTSPTLSALIEEVLRDFPDAKWVQYDPAGRDAARSGTRLIFGEYVNAVYDFTRADVVLSLDADFLSCGPGTVRYTHDFASRRRPGSDPAKASMNRLYVVESMLTNTGASADHRLPLRNGEVEPFARALAAELGVDGVAATGALPDKARAWLAPLTADLRAQRGRCLVLAGDGQPPAVHALAHALNDALGNVGQTVRYTAPVEARSTDQLADLRTLAEDMRAGRIELLAVLGCNPVYTAPVDLNFAASLKKVPLRFHLGLYQDETAVLCHWHVPEAHYLEAWGDARAYDGTVTILQPLIAPLYGGRSAAEVLAAIAGRPETVDLDIVRRHWRETWSREKRSTKFEDFWHKSLQDGVAPESALPSRAVRPRAGWAGQLPALSPDGAGGRDTLEVSFRPDPTIFDGRFANNGWLQELPKPVTKLTWDNAAFISPATARRLGIAAVAGSANPVGVIGGEHGDAAVEVLDLRYRGRSVSAPVWVLPGHAEDAVTLHLGYGRTRAGRVGGNGQEPVGFNAYLLRTADAPWFGAGLEISRAGRRYTLACTQMHYAMEGRDPVRHATLEDYRKDPTFARTVTVAHGLEHEIEALVPGPHEGTPPEPGTDRRLVPLTLYPGVPYEGHRWGMSIDLAACVGCSACVVACQAENNIPVVGKKEVARGREMHWLRIDRYFSGEPEDPGSVSTWFQPLPCMHCEKAPCELVCPVGATVHSHDGLNDMVYNRCVGTRYCSNNCPYKVRRFNFLFYAKEIYETPSLKLLQNPEVTVRSRGVMEKCTYCVQRIRTAEIASERENRPLADGDVVTACQAVCPANAIVFGDINDPTSDVRRCKAEPRNYGLLAELNTRPRTTYLAAVRNPNPAIPEGV
jgi:MoCo/4Fe-4S cofactor protein with predicted Tat translocation signal